MSRLSKLKNDVLAHARKTRGTWYPSEDAWHLKLFAEYYRRHGKAVPTHGRCEYFYVVIWEMLWRARKVFWALGALAILVTVVLLSFNFLPTVLGFVVGVVGAVYVVVGIHVGLHMLNELHHGFRFSRLDWLDEMHRAVLWLVALVFLPIEAVVAILVLLGFASIQIIDATAESKAMQWFFRAKVFERRGLTWVRPWMFLVLVGLIAMQWIPGIINFDFVLLFAIVLTSSMLGIALFAERSAVNAREKGRHVREAWYKSRDVAAADGAVRRLFTYQHPEWVQAGVVDEQQFAAWLERYELHCQKVWGKSYREVYFFTILDSINFIKFHELFGQTKIEFFEELGGYKVYPEPARGIPVRRHGYLDGVVEFFALMGATLRAAKMKVCPIVEIPENIR